ncbi:MAG: GntR family transcriptional regulator [Sphingomonadaceae bacterium]|nr:GntR family transcriptional regulator [Sphingomonadaceae bacterium]
MSRASDHAYTVIRGMILAGELPPGSQLSEEALALRCAVSRTPVRDALRRLEADLLIRRSESQRSFVADWSDDDIEDAFELRAMLEAQAARRAATRINAAQLEALRVHNHGIETAIAADLPDISTFLEHNRAFHEIIVEAAGSPRLASLLTRLIEQPVVWRTAQNYDRENLHRSHREHEELVAAFARRDAGWAASIMTGHIRRAYYAYLDAYAVQRQAAE